MCVSSLSFAQTATQLVLMNAAVCRRSAKGLQNLSLNVLSLLGSGGSQVFVYTYTMHAPACVCVVCPCVCVQCHVCAHMCPHVCVCIGVHMLIHLLLLLCQNGC